MDRTQRSRLAAGIVLILLGFLFLTVRLFPQIGELIQLEFSWPLIIIGVSLFLLFIGLISGTPEMAVPASIVGGIGGLLYWQNLTGNWESWAYAWTLIPGFVGVGIILSGLFGGNTRKDIASGSWLVLMSMVMFLIFAGLFGGLDLLGPYWPVLLIGVGILLLVRTLIRK